MAGSFTLTPGALTLRDLRALIEAPRKVTLSDIAAELPAAAFCFWIAVRTERFLAFVLEEVDESHLPTAAESATESDLVGVLEVTPDGEPRGEPGDARSWRV